MMMISQMNTGNLRRSMRGFTLVELLVSVTIGLILMLFLSSLYFNSKSSSRLNDDNARIQEDGRFALNLIGRSLMQAGYGNMLTGNTTDFPPVSAPTLTGLIGCDNGFAMPIAAVPACASAAGTDSAFAVSYTSEPYDATNSPISGAGIDCSGVKAIGATATQGGLITNSFYRDAATSILYCMGNPGGTPQKILSNVDQMKVTYGVDTASKYVPTQMGVNASVAGAVPFNQNNRAGWGTVITATVCLDIHSSNNVISTSAGQTYTNCSGQSVTASDHLLHTTMTQVFTLRNNATPSLIN